MTLRTARSVSGSFPMTCAISFERSESRTSISAESPTTWLLVIMWPAGVMMTPAPEPGAFGTRSGAASRPLPTGLVGKRLTTEGLAVSASSVMTACISSRSRRPFEPAAGAAAGSAEPAGSDWTSVITESSDNRAMSRRRMLLVYLR